MEAAVVQMLQRHRASDQAEIEPTLGAKSVARIESLQRDAEEVREWLRATPQDRKGVRGSIVKSNRTDNASAKIATDKGVIQDYCGVAAVDAKHQVIVEAQAHGTMPRLRPASARPASSSAATARTAPSAATRPSSSEAPSATACPAPYATSACASPTPRRHECIDIAIDFGISGQYVTRLLDQAAIFRGYPKIVRTDNVVRTDNGPEFTSRAFMG